MFSRLVNALIQDSNTSHDNYTCKQGWKEICAFCFNSIAFQGEKSVHLPFCRKYFSFVSHACLFQRTKICHLKIYLSDRTVLRDFTLGQRHSHHGSALWVPQYACKWLSFASGQCLQFCPRGHLPLLPPNRFFLCYIQTV